MLNWYDGSLKQLMQWLILTLLLPLLFLNGWLALKVFDYFQPLVTVIVLASLLALILNYPVQFLLRQGIRRSQAVMLIVLLAMMVAIAIGVVLIPVLLEDVTEVVQLLPQWIESGTEQIQAFQDWIAARGLPVSISRVVNQLVSVLPGELQALADQALNLVLDTVGSVSEALLTIVLTFYFLADGGRLTQELVDRLPGSWAIQLQRSLQENFQNYFLGQAALASTVGVCITIAFTILQIPYSLLFGLGVGIMTLIPFGDIVTCIVISVLLAFQNFWLGVKVLVVAVILDQLIDQIIAPRLLGKFTGLRPVWVLLSLLIGTKIGGLLGLVIAVPVASVIKSALNGFDSSEESILAPEVVMPPEALVGTAKE